MLSHEGKVMCVCSKRKQDWYLSRGLARIVPEKEQTFQLLFVPQGSGQTHSFYLQPQANRCVCCGSTENLTKHHLVPYCYRQHMPKVLKNSSSYDILPLCVECHTKYETQAHALKVELAKPYAGERQAKLPSVTKAKILNTLLHYRQFIPAEKQTLLLNKLGSELGYSVTLEQALELALEPQHKPAPQDILFAQSILMHKISSGTIKEFIVSWRQHFLKTMNPQFMPDKWSPTYFETRHEHYFNQSQSTTSANTL